MGILGVFVMLEWRGECKFHQSAGDFMGKVRPPAAGLVLKQTHAVTDPQRFTELLLP